MQIVYWLSTYVKKPKYLCGAAKLLVFVAMVYMAILATRSESPVSAEQHWWWNIH